MDRNFTHILLTIIAVLLGFIGYQLMMKNSSISEDKKSSQEEVPKIRTNTEPITSTSVTRTPNFSFASWSTVSENISENPKTFLLYENVKTDPKAEKIVYTKNLPSLSDNPEKNKKYAFVADSVFGSNSYKIYEEIEKKTRVFILKHDTQAILIYLSDSTTLVPHYVDLSSLKFSSK